jgi:hypothetical protein
MHYLLLISYLKRSRTVTFEHVDNEIVNMNQAIDVLEFSEVIQVSNDPLAGDPNLAKPKDWIRSNMIYKQISSLCKIKVL